ncbi:MAG: hypothetical protein J6W14_07710 [Clostridia bacterium]|nr:hypothetical protein [Clostridia bacterium]
MVGQILKSKRGKWAVALAVIAVLALVGSMSEGSTDGLLGAVVVLGIAVILAMPAIKAAKNPPPAPTLQDLGIRVTQEELDAFNARGTLPNVENGPVILDQDERAVYACAAERVETKNRKLGTTGSGAGASFRVTKGVRVRTGSTGSKSVYGDVEMTHSGEFVVTTKRISFVAASRAFEEKLSSISAVSVDDGCLTIMTAKTSYAMRMPLAEYPCSIIKHCIKSL